MELEVFREFVGREKRFDFCFVNDGSQDNTSEVLRRAVELEPERFLLVDNVDNRGKAEAVRNTLKSEEVTNMVPATLLKTHKDWHLFLDKESSSLIDS